MIENYDDDSLVIDVNKSKNRKSRESILCVICHVKLEEVSQNNFKCPVCKNSYFLGYEIMEYEEDDFSSSHSNIPTIELEGIQGINKPIMLTAEDDIDFSTEEKEKKSGFYSMDYVLSPGKKIVNLEEHIPTAEEEE